MFKDYCPSFYQTQRRATRSLFIGNLGLGSSFPIRIQSMTTTDTRDVKATAVQIMQLADAGCDIVRMTVQGKKEAQACGEIKNILLKKGYAIPLVADIHFYPPAALEVVEYVEKVRINPGNFADRRAQFKQLTYTDESYALEIERIEQALVPLIEKCKRLKRVIRIGTNHGSLSDRIMNRYGDTALGMVESALEYTHICRKHDFHDLVFSMKSSNVQVMIEAYRLLVSKMNELNWDYPLHLGVTEAGEGREGRVKSAAGIGALLLDGLGDTIRISLTEEPIREIEPCRLLIEFANLYIGKGVCAFAKSERGMRGKMSLPPFHPQASVALSPTKEEIEHPDFYKHLGLYQKLGQLQHTDLTVDMVITSIDHPKIERLKQAGVAVLKELPQCTTLSDAIKEHVFSTQNSYVHEARKFEALYREHDLTYPYLLKRGYSSTGEQLYIEAGAELGSLLSDYIGDGIWIEAPVSLDERRLLSFAILQGARRRSTKTEFISCPGCGRTLFDLQEVSARIRQKTDHLKGVKIAIMGCIVNGPGEMADADFGYVGSKPGCVDLYIGKERIEKDIPMDEAQGRLIELIKREGAWVDPIV